MPVALQEGVAVQTMKPMGGGFLLQAKAITPAECLRYALTQPASVVIHGMNKMQHLEEALGVVKNFQPMTPAQIDVFAAKTKQAASSGKYELYKTTSHFDSTAHHPPWLGMASLAGAAKSMLTCRSRCERAADRFRAT